MDDQLKRDLERSLAIRAELDREDAQDRALAKLTSDARAYRSIGRDGWVSCISLMRECGFLDFEIEKILRSDRMTTFASANDFRASFTRMIIARGSRPVVAIG